MALVCISLKILLIQFSKVLSGDSVSFKCSEYFPTQVICAMLTLNQRSGRITLESREEFSKCGQNLFKSYMNTQHHGPVVYNKQVGLKVQQFVEDTMQNSFPDA